jgi:UDP-glucose 4-epimerase
MVIAIIGSEGFIGRHIASYFSGLGIDILGCDLKEKGSGDYHYYKIINPAEDYNCIFKTKEIDFCINAAGNGRVSLSIEQPQLDFEANVRDTFFVLESIRKYTPGCKYINLSSAAVYGNPKFIPVHENAAIDPVSPYGWHKYYSELICREYSSLFGIKTCSLRPFSIYGPGLKKQIFWDLYQKSKQGDVLELSGTGQESRDFIYINDFCRALELIINSQLEKGEVINVANGVEVKLYQVAALFLNLFSTGKIIRFNGHQRKGDPLNWKADISLLSSLGYLPEMSLELGLNKYIEWLRESE